MMLLWLHVLPTECVLFVCKSEEKKLSLSYIAGGVGVYKQGGVFIALHEMGR